MAPRGRGRGRGRGGRGTPAKTTKVLKSSSDEVGEEEVEYNEQDEGDADNAEEIIEDKKIIKSNQPTPSPAVSAEEKKVLDNDEKMEVVVTEGSNKRSSRSRIPLSSSSSAAAENVSASKVTKSKIKADIVQISTSTPTVALASTSTPTAASTKTTTPSAPLPLTNTTSVESPVVEQNVDKRQKVSPSIAPNSSSSSSCASQDTTSKRGRGRGGRGTPPAKSPTSLKSPRDEDDENENDKNTEEKIEHINKVDDENLVPLTAPPADPVVEETKGIEDKEDKMKIVVTERNNKRNSRSRASSSSSAVAVTPAAAGIVSASKVGKNKAKADTVHIPTSTTAVVSTTTSQSTPAPTNTEIPSTSLAPVPVPEAIISPATVESAEAIAAVNSMVVDKGKSHKAIHMVVSDHTTAATTAAAATTATAAVKASTETMSQCSISVTSTSQAVSAVVVPPAATATTSSATISPSPPVVAAAFIPKSHITTTNKAFPPQFDTSYIHKIYIEHIQSNDLSKLRQLSLNGYLETYLWLHYQEKKEEEEKEKERCNSDEFTVSILVMINEKFRHGSSSALVWNSLVSSPSVPAVEEAAVVSDDESVLKYERFMTRVIQLSHSFHPFVTTTGNIHTSTTTAATSTTTTSNATNGSSSDSSHSQSQQQQQQYLNLQIQYTTFFIHVFQSLDIPFVRKFILKYLSLEMWVHVSETRRVEEYSRQPLLRKHWSYLVKMKLLTSESDSGGSGVDNNDASQGIDDTTTTAAAVMDTETTAAAAAAASVSGGVTGKAKGRKSNASSSSSSASASKPSKKQKTTHDATAATTAAPTAMVNNTKDISNWFYSLVNTYLFNLEHFDIMNAKEDAEEEEQKKEEKPTTATASTTTKMKMIMMSIIYFEKFVELLIDLLSQLPTRRFVNTLLDDMHVLVRVKRTPLYGFLTSSSSSFSSITNTKITKTMNSSNSNNKLDLNTIHKRKLLINLINKLELYLNFEVDDHTGKALLPHDLVEKSSVQVTLLQSIAFQKHPIILKDLIYSSLGALVTNKVVLENYFNLLSVSDVSEIAKAMKYVSERDIQPYIKKTIPTDGMHIDRSDINTASSSSSSSTHYQYQYHDDHEDELRSFLYAVFEYKLIKRPSQLDMLNRLSLYPTEQLLWDEDAIPSSQSFMTTDHGYNRSYAIPKLNVQFLTLYDYLLRTFELFRLESAYEVREDIMDAVKRMNPRNATASTSSMVTATASSSATYQQKQQQQQLQQNQRNPFRNPLLSATSTVSVATVTSRSGTSGTRGSGGVVFSGWARMALPVVALSIDEVTEPRIGEVVPAQVKGSVQIDLSRVTASDIRDEWESLRDHDVVFLICITPVAVPAAVPAAAAVSTGGGRGGEESIDFADRYGVKYVRGGEVFELRDEEDVILNDPASDDETSDANPLTNRLMTLISLEDTPDERLQRRGNKRKLRLRFDPNQYYSDIQNDCHDCYDSFNLIVRRKPEESTFKAILETIRDLLNNANSSVTGSTSGSGGSVTQGLPPWLHELILGYGDPTAAHFSRLQSSSSHSGSPQQQVIQVQTEAPDLGDTFLDAQHILDSFILSTSTAANVVIEQHSSGGSGSGSGDQSERVRVEATPSNIQSLLTTPPYHVTVEAAVKQQVTPATTDHTALTTTQSSTSISHSTALPTVVIRNTVKLNPGPYPEDVPPVNRVRFTPSQVQAIHSGIQPGLTMIVGPPGTGKTDVAVQIIARLYHNHPTQKILIVTHSNAALNDIFEKIMRLDIDSRHLLRLGSGEVELAESLAVGGAGGSGRGQGESFNKQGRVNWSLARRIQLLAQVQSLGVSLGVPGDVGYTCETASYFYTNTVQLLINNFEKSCRNSSVQSVAAIFPFHTYFTHTSPTASASLFSSSNTTTSGSTNNTTSSSGSSNTNTNNSSNDEALFEQDVEVARGCFRHLQRLFDELADYRAFEVLRNQTLRSDYLLTKQARIVAMTCTHAAMTRRRLIELDFHYDSLVMEEAAQVLEVETLVPLLLQKADPMHASRLKRVTLLGDHYQLPPVIKHMVYQKYSSLDQSLFTRFIRLGVPTVLLNQQGRARPEIAALYSWRYSNLISTGLGNLSNVLTDSIYRTANPGFLHTYQFIDVPDFQNKGESAPTPHFYQNLGEAEYVVAVYQYMRLLGYPSEKITILTTYNGQKQLIRDIIQLRCKNTKLFGFPHKITTVDKYQGQQNEFILLSLVRTESVGHLRDVRRLVVALSRARLGLYVFGRKSLFESCYELKPAFDVLLRKSIQLQLVIGEEYPLVPLVSTQQQQQVQQQQRRLVTSEVESELTHTVDSVTAMGILVYQMVQQASVLMSTVSSHTHSTVSTKPLTDSSENSTKDSSSVTGQATVNENTVRMNV